MISTALVNELKALLSTAKKGVIIPHKNPDGDAMGSCLAWMHYLNAKGHSFQLLSPTSYPDFLKWLPGDDTVVQYEENMEVSEKLLNESEVVFCLDFNHLGRIGELGQKVEQLSCSKVVIDHHLYPDEFADILFSDTGICSTAQMVYQLIEALDDKSKITEDIARCIYTGIMTDTGSFKFASTDYDTHRIAGEIIQLGVNVQEIHQQIYDTHHEGRLRLLGYLLLNKLVVNHTLNYAYFSLTMEEMKEFKFQKGDTEGVVNYALSIKGIEIAAFFRESEEHIRISFRSKGKKAVNTIANDHFNGGGHKFAAGGMSELNLEETINKFEKEIKNYV